MCNSALEKNLTVLIEYNFSFPGLYTGEMLIMEKTVVLISVNGQLLKILCIVFGFYFLTTNLMKLTKWLIAQSPFW